jgi:hypothetical protein
MAGRNGAVAFAEVLLLLASIAATIAAFWRISRRAGILMPAPSCTQRPLARGLRIDGGPDGQGSRCSPVTFTLDRTGTLIVELDEDKIDRAVLALLSLTLHEKGFISDPKSNAKAVALSDAGLAEARRLAQEMFVATRA